MGRGLTGAIKAGELSAQTDAGALAGLIMTVIQRMTTLERGGATRAKLLRVAEAAMQGWPT
jgi:hypothetical protein